MSPANSPFARRVAFPRIAWRLSGEPIDDERHQRNNRTCDGACRNFRRCQLDSSMDAPLLGSSTHRAFGPSRKSGKRSQRIVAILLMLVLVLGAFAGLCVASYCAGRNTESELRFLDPRGAPSKGDVVVLFPVEYALRTNESNDVVFVGDSTCTCGVDPVAFQSGARLRTV
jgi:hypothetical protein